MKKRLLALMVLAVLTFTTAAFGETADTTAPAETVEAMAVYSNAFDEYEQKGYSHGYAGIDGDENGNVLSVYFTSTDFTDCVKVEAAVTDEEVTAFEALDFFDDDYAMNEWELVTALPSDRVTVTSLNDLIPAEEEFAGYVGQPVSALQDDGYEYETDETAADGTRLRIFRHYETGVKFAVTLEGDPLDADALSDEQIGFQVVKTIAFHGFE